MKTITRLLATAALLFGVVGGVTSVKAYTVVTKTPVLLTGGVDGCNPAPDYYVIQMQGWQSFIAYQDATGISFDEDSYLQFDLKETVQNGNVRLTFTFNEEFTTKDWNNNDITTDNLQVWWCLGTGGEDAPDNSTPYNKNFDESKYWLKKGFGSNWDIVKDLKITKVTVDNFNLEEGGESVLVTYNVEGGSLCGQSLTIKNSNATTFGYYSGVFSPTATQKNIFKFQPFEVGDYQKIIIEFGAETPSRWAIYTGSLIDIPAGETKYEISLNGSNLDEFTIFNWDANPEPINVSGVYLYKEEEEYATLSYDEFGLAAVDKKYLTATGGLTYNQSTGVLTSNGAAGTMTLEFDSPVDLKYLKTYEVTRSGGNDGIISSLEFYDEGNVKINTWSSSKLSNDGLDNNATNAFLNNNPVKKMVWVSVANAVNNEKSFTISGVKFQLKTMSCLRAGETQLNTLAWNKIDNSGTATPHWNMNGTSDTYYGDYSGNATHYADLTGFEELRVYCKDNNTGFRAFFINADASGTNQYATSSATWNSTEKYYSLDLSTVTKWNDKVALKTIKSDNNGGAPSEWNVTNIVVYKTPAANAPRYTLAGSGLQQAETVAALADATATSIDATGVTGITTDSETGRTLLTSANLNCLFLGSTGNGHLANTQNVVNGSACASLVLSDGNYPFKAPSAFTATSASYNRAFTANRASTICLPFALTAEEAAAAGTFYELTAYNEGDLTFTEVTETEAYKPYLFKAASANPFSSYSSKAIAATPTDLSVSVNEGAAVMTGTMARQSVNGKYGWNSTSGEFSKATSDEVTIDPFRAYITISDGSSNARMAAHFIDKSSTGIKEVSEAQSFQNTVGKFFENGKIVIFKKGLKFNANGQQIK